MLKQAVENGTLFNTHCSTKLHKTVNTTLMYNRLVNYIMSKVLANSLALFTLYLLSTQRTILAFFWSCVQATWQI